MTKTLHAARFLLTGPLILLLLVVLNSMTSAGPLVGPLGGPRIGIAWLISLFRVLRALAIAGGLAALGALLLRRR